MKKLKEKTPLKYLYISSACITIILSVILYYKYTKSNVSSSKTNKDTTNTNRRRYISILCMDTKIQI